MRLHFKKTFLVVILLCFLFIFNFISRKTFPSNYCSKSTFQKFSIVSTPETCENKNKYIRYECGGSNSLCGGWADRLRGLMGAYMWSIFTKREFLIDMDYPCSLSLMLEPNVIKWNKPIKCYNYFNDTILNHKQQFTSIRLNKMSNRLVKFLLFL
jgi:hypothetical protein